MEVTLVEAMPHLVPTEDAAIAAGLERAFRRRKIGIRTGVAVDSCQANGDVATVRLADGSELRDELVLMALAGERTPRVWATPKPECDSAAASSIRTSGCAPPCPARMPSVISWRDRSWPTAALPTASS